MPNRCEIVDNRASEQAFKIIAKLGINFFFRKIGFFNFYNFSEVYYIISNKVIFLLHKNF